MKKIYDDDNGSLTRLTVKDIVKDMSYEELVKMRAEGGEFLQEAILEEISKREALMLMKKLGAGKKFPDVIASVAVLDSPMAFWLGVSFFDQDMKPVPVSMVIQVELSKKHCPSADETGKFFRKRHFSYIEHRDALLHRIEELVGTCAVSVLNFNEFPWLVKMHETNFLEYRAQKHLLSLTHKSETTARRDSL